MKDFVFKKLPTVDYILRTTWNAVVKFYTNQATKHDYTMAMGFTLLSIDPDSGTPSTSLGPRMGMEPTSLSRTLKTLEEMDLIQRKPNPNDGRSVIVSLTDEGVKSRNIVKEIVIAFNKKVEEEFGIEKLKTFFEVSQGIQRLIDENKILNE